MAKIEIDTSQDITEDEIVLLIIENFIVFGQAICDLKIEEKIFRIRLQHFGNGIGMVEKMCCQNGEDEQFEPLFNRICSKIKRILNPIILYEHI